MLVLPIRSFELTLGLLGVALCLALLARRLRVPPSVTFVLGGMVLALIPGLPAVDLDPDFVLALFLPPLLQSSAFYTNWREFKANLTPILTLAFGAVIFTMFAVGWVVHTLLPSLPWAACFALGAIVSPPDAVAASSVLERVRLPRKLLSIIEGESLINDASGLVLYRFAVASALSGAVRPVAVGISFVLVCVGGLAIGWAVAVISAWVIRRLPDVQMAIVASFLAGWGSYLAAESVSASGVLAVVATGLLSSRLFSTQISARTRQEARATWSVILFVFEALVFILIGLSLHGVLLRFGGLPDMISVQLAAVVAATVVAARFAWLLIGAWLPARLACLVLRRPPILGLRALLVLACSGMRGVVSLAAALALPAGFPGRDMIIFITFGVILSTLLLHGTTLGPIITLLRLGVARGDGDTEDVARARAIVHAAARSFIEGQSIDPLEGAIARDLLDEYRLRDTTAAGASAGSAAARAEWMGRVSLRLRAVEAARSALRAAEDAVDEESARLLERDLDLEEIQLRGRAGQLV